jgi:NAD(P)-dependent dehydrogenase (short-subunit alcohol dehydrogenase family)
MTERQRRLWVSNADMESFKAAQCLHESLTGDAIAPAVLFLASDDARMITKQCLLVDGGIH